MSGGESEVNLRNITLKRISLVFAVVALVLAVTFSLVFYLKSQLLFAEDVETVTLGMEPNQVNALIYVAENQSYFASNGLNVTVKDYASGSAAVEGMLNGEVDIATATEFVLASKALSDEQVSAFTSITEFQHIYLLGRTDKGVVNVSDLEGKRIGLPLKTAAEFYLGKFLDLQGLSINHVSLVNVAPAESIEALVNGSVDAVVAWQPNVDVLLDQLGEGLTVWKVQSEQSAYDLVISTNSWVAGHAEGINRFLKALVQAESYLTNNPSQVKTMIKEHFGYDDVFIEEVWHQYQFSLSLKQATILAMEDEARWMIDNNLTNSVVVPDFLKHLYLEGLETIKPESVNIIT